jgi:hypothetical protein
VAEEAGLLVRGRIPPHTDHLWLEGLAHAAPSGEEIKSGTLQSILKDLHLEM